MHASPAEIHCFSFNGFARVETNNCLDANLRKTCGTRPRTLLRATRTRLVISCDKAADLATSSCFLRVSKWPGSAFLVFPQVCSTPLALSASARDFRRESHHR